MISSIPVSETSTVHRRRRSSGDSCSCKLESCRWCQENARWNSVFEARHGDAARAYYQGDYLEGSASSSWNMLNQLISLDLRIGNGRRKKVKEEVPVFDVKFRQTTTEEQTVRVNAPDRYAACDKAFDLLDPETWMIAEIRPESRAEVREIAA